MTHTAKDIQKAHELINFFLDQDRGFEWLTRAASHFANSDRPYAFDMAIDLIEHPTMQDTPKNRANGYRPYTTPQELWSRTLRVFS